MFLLFVIHCVTANSILKESNSLYEEWRQRTQSLVTRTPMKMIRETLGLRQLDQDNDDEFEIPETDMDLKHLRISRIMQEKGSDVPSTPVANITINEYLRQGPLIPLKCKLAQPILINVTQHYCFKQRVNYLQYQEITINNSANCTIRYRLHYGCLCPPDFYGEYCRFWNQILCDIEQPSQNCDIIVDKDYYNKKIDGNPPCKQYQSENFVENVRTVCYNQLQASLNRSVFHPEENYTVIWSNYTKGISALLPQQYKFGAPIPDNPNDPQQYIQYATMPEETEKEIFKYEENDCFGANTNILCSSFLFEITPYVRVINWTYISESQTTQIDYILSLQQMQGKSQIEIPININKVNPLYGRYSVEIGFVNHVYGFYEQYPLEDNQIDQKKPMEYLPHLKPKILFFEDQFYKEPTSSDKKLGRDASVGLIIAIITLIFAILMIYKYRIYLTECCYPRVVRVVPEKYTNQKNCCQKMLDCFKVKQEEYSVAEPTPQHQNQSLE